MLYEVTIALNPDLAAEKAKKITEGVEGAVVKSGGKVEKVESLGIKNLAYPVRGFSQASFGRFYLQLDSEKIGELRHQLEREPALLRVFVVKLEGGEIKSNG